MIGSWLLMTRLSGNSLHSIGERAGMMIKLPDPFWSGYLPGCPMLLLPKRKRQLFVNGFFGWGETMCYYSRA
jgi:hypothetical protein